MFPRTATPAPQHAPSSLLAAALCAPLCCPRCLLLLPCKPSQGLPTLSRRCPPPCAGKYDQVRINFANPDMVGHTGDLEATVSCCKLVDQCVKVGGGRMPRTKCSCCFSSACGEGALWGAHTMVPAMLHSVQPPSKACSSQHQLVNLLPLGSLRPPPLLLCPARSTHIRPPRTFLQPLHPPCTPLHPRGTSLQPLPTRSHPAPTPLHLLPTPLHFLPTPTHPLPPPPLPRRSCWRWWTR